MKILIVGAGSIGRRHAENFHSLGCEIGAVDPQLIRLEELQLKVPTIHASNNLDYSLSECEWDGIVLATPPAFHVEQMDLCSGSPLLVEKNLCLNAGEVSHLHGPKERSERGLSKVLMGYTWRWWKSLQDVKTLLPKIGDIRQVRLTMAAHLADWHPYEPIEQFYAAERGGVLNEAHWHDIMLWFWGWPEKAFSSHGNISDLPIKTPDVLDSIFFYPGFRVNLHYDLYKRPHDRSMTIVGERGTLEWTPNLIRLSNVATGGWTEYPNDAQRNDMFLNMAKEFIEMIENQIKPKCTLQDGINVMKLLEYSKESQEKGAIVDILV